MTRRRALAALLAAALAAALAGCASAPRPQPLPAAPVDDRPPLAGSPVPPPEPADDGPWTAALQDVCRRLQQAALQQGSVSIDRTLDDRLRVRLPISAAFDGPSQLSRRAEPFLGTLAEALTQHADVAASIAENPPRGQRAQPRAASVLRFLLIRGVRAAQLSIEPQGTRRVALPALEQAAGAPRQIELLLSAHGR